MCFFPSRAIFNARIVSIITLFFIVPWGANSSCPVEDFDEVVAFCTEDNELGITYPAGTSDRGVAYFSQKGSYGQPLVNTGCLPMVYAPAWYAMQIDQDGSLLIEISHSEKEDVDFACYGPYEGASKNDMLKMICSDPVSFFATDINVNKYHRAFFDEYRNDDYYRLTDCRFSGEYQPVYDTLAKYSNLLKLAEDAKIQFEREIRGGRINYSEDEITRQSDSIKVVIKGLSDKLDQYKLMDPRYYDMSSNCYRADVDPFPDGKMVDCSFAPNYKELCRIDNAKHGEWYLLLLSNYSRNAGNILFKKVGGDATTDCTIIIDASVPDSVCEGEDIRMMVNNAPSGATFVWSGPNGFSSTLQSPVIRNASMEHAGTYTVQMKANGMTSPVVELEVTVNKAYKVDTTIHIVYGDTLDFEGEKLFSDGEYEHMYATVAGCDSLVHITLLVDSFDVDITAENNGPLCEGESLVLSAHHIPDRVNIRWMGPHGFSSEDSLVTIPNVSLRDSGTYQLVATFFDKELNVSSTHVDVYASNKIELFDKLVDSLFLFNDLVIREPGEYTVNLKNVDGCDSVVTLRLERVLDSIRIVPEAFFSPNGDGVRDLWFIGGVETVPTTVKIYDRKGKVVRVYDVYTNAEGWDGKDSNGNDLPSTDYWYVISNRTIDKLFVGHVALVR